MSTISNRFYVTALEDGTTLHGNLVSDKSLSQSWNGTSAVPDWTVAADQPTIYLTLLSGNTLVQPSSTFTWYYNNTPITISDTRFQITTKSVTYGGQTKAMPALKIVDNLASSDNVDVDIIRFSGSYIIDTAEIAFSADAQIRISTITSGSYMGVVNFVNGISDITTLDQTIVMYGVLYTSEGRDTGGYTTKWYLNNSVTPTSGTTIGSYTNAFQLSAAQVVDHATVRCEFYKGNELKYTAYAGVDDMQDPEFMYIQTGVSANNTANGNAASLRKGEKVYFNVWVGSRDDAAVRTGWANATYKVQLLDGDGVIITSSGLDDIPNPDTGDTAYYRTLNKNSQNKAYFGIAYDTVNGNKKNLTGIIIASVNT